MKNFITILLVSVVILFTLGGCSNPVSNVLNDMDRTTITYNNEKYVATTDWSIDDSSYKEKVIENDGTKIHIWIYDNDKNVDFISDSGSLLYHKESSSYPKNNYNSIESIELYKGDENKIIKDKTCIENLLSTINGKKNKNSSSKTDEVLYSISIHYKDYPASYSLGELVKCESGNYKIVDNYGYCYNLNADICPKEILK